MVARNIALAEQTGAHVHLAHVSTAGSVELVRQAKAQGVRVTAEVTPHHLALTHEAVLTGPGESYGALAYDTNAKVNPPLRTPADVDACVAGPHRRHDRLHRDGPRAARHRRTSSVSSTTPRSASAASRRRSRSASPRLDLAIAIERLTIAPVRALGLDAQVRGPRHAFGGRAGGRGADRPERRVDGGAGDCSRARGRTRRWRARRCAGGWWRRLSGGKVVWRA